MGKRIVVIGNSVLPLALAGQIAMRNSEVVYIDVSGTGLFRKLMEHDCRLVYSGEVDAESVLKAATDEFDVIKDAEILMIAPAPSSYDAVFNKIIPFLGTVQHICFFPGSFGAIKLKEKLDECGISGIIISEAVSFPWVCQMRSETEVVVCSRKKSLKLSVYPQKSLNKELELYNSFFDIFKPALSFIETSLENINIVLHPLPVLLNIGSVERNPKTFRHYIDGVTATVGKALERMDQERLSVGRALGMDLESTLSQLKTYYGDNEFTTIREYVTDGNGPYPLVSGFGIDSRYISEDIPCLVWPMLQIAREVGVTVPMTKLCIDMACLFLGVKLPADGSYKKYLSIRH